VRTNKRKRRQARQVQSEKGKAETMRRNKLFYFIVLFLLFVSPVKVESVKDYLGSPLTTRKAYVAGVGNGLFWANVYLKKSLYCPPPNLAVYVDNYVDILDREIDISRKNKTLTDDTHIELLLIEGLKRTFPC
jgi:hypothetical protein